MRSPDYNVPEKISDRYPAEISLAIFERMCRVRYFELGVVDGVERKTITCPVYLSTGQEAIAAALAPELRSYQIFAQHRAHDLYLSVGGSPEKLRDELLGLPSGTSGGRAGSNCIQCHEDGLSMFGHHGLIGENVPQAVGAALGNGRKTVCIFGDGAAEEDYVFSAIGFAATHKLPVLFLCMDNNLSILTIIKTRRNWSITKVAEGFGLPAVDIADDPWAVLSNAEQLTKKLPALMNCYVCRGYWHVGVGVDGPPEWDRFGLVRQALIDRGHDKAIREIEDRTRRQMEKVWGKELLLKPLGK